MDDQRSEIARTLGLLGSLGFMAAACIIGGVLAGCYADDWLGTSPLFLVVGTLAGVVGTCVLAYKSIMRHVH